MKAILLAAAVLALAAAGCTNVTHINYYGDEKPTVVHDTVYVEHGSAEPHEEWAVEPDTLIAPLPNPESGQSGIVTWVEALDPGTAIVEITIDYDQGCTTWLMSGNLLSGSGLRFELNAMARRWESTGVVEYWLVPEFISARNWNGTAPETSGQQSGRITVMEEVETAPASRSISTDGRPSGRKEVSGRPVAVPEDQPSSETVPGETVLPSLLLRVDQSQYRLTDLDDFDCVGHATMMYGVTVRIPGTASVLESLASGVSGSAQLRDHVGTMTGTFTEDNFTNFGSFLRLVSGT